MQKNIHLSETDSVAVGQVYDVFHHVDYSPIDVLKNSLGTEMNVHG